MAEIRAAVSERLDLILEAVGHEGQAAHGRRLTDTSRGGRLALGGCGLGRHPVLICLNPTAFKILILILQALPAAIRMLEQMLLPGARMGQSALRCTWKEFQYSLVFLIA